MLLANLASLIKNEVDDKINASANPANKYRYRLIVPLLSADSRKFFLKSQTSHIKMCLCTLKIQ